MTVSRATADAPRSVYLDLERREDRARLLSEPSLFLSRNRDALVVLDEVQHARRFSPSSAARSISIGVCPDS